MAAKAPRGVFICGPGIIPGRQCRPLSYFDSMENADKHPTHVHRDSEGRWRATAWGTAKDCNYEPAAQRGSGG